MYGPEVPARAALGNTRPAAAAPASASVLRRVWLTPRWLGERESAVRGGSDGFKSGLLLCGVQRLGLRAESEAVRKGRGPRGERAARTAVSRESSNIKDRTRSARPQPSHDDVAAWRP